MITSSPHTAEELGERIANLLPVSTSRATRC